MENTKEDFATYKSLADLIFPDAKDWKIYEQMYPERDLEKNAEVTRFAPSPTGFIHIGGLYTALVSEKIARETDGKFLLRIEDTDQKREVENGIEGILDSIYDFGIFPDEGPYIKDLEILEKGKYQSYIQSKRKEIYESFAKKLIEEGKAYPCFMEEDEMNEIRKLQAANKEPLGIYGRWAKYRNLNPKEAEEKIKNGEPFVVRLKSPGKLDRKIEYKDVIKGKLEFPENILDIVIIKKDGLPTYHFAHSIDDHFMRVTLITRSDEWLPSVPLHLQLFDVLGFKRVKYAHLAPLLKLDEGNKRKLSKRKDPESAASYYMEEGIPILAVKEYLYNIMNADFENWRKQNPEKDLSEFNLKLNKMGVSGALFDMVKLLNVSKDVIARMNKEEVFEKGASWAKTYDKELYNMLNEEKEYSLNVLNIERESGRRKDLSKWLDLKENISYMYSDKFKENVKEIKDYEFSFDIDKDKKEELTNIIEQYVNEFLDFSDDKTTWFNKVKDLAEKNGYAREIKEYKKDKEKYKGHVGDISGYIRIILTSKSRTPDLYEIINVLGKDEIEKRIEKFKNINID